MKRRAKCELCGKKSRHNQKGQCINCVTNKAKGV